MPSVFTVRVPPRGTALYMLEMTEGLIEPRCIHVRKYVVMFSLRVCVCLTSAGYAGGLCVFVCACGGVFSLVTIHNSALPFSPTHFLYLCFLVSPMFPHLRGPQDFSPPLKPFVLLCPPLILSTCGPARYQLCRKAFASHCSMSSADMDDILWEDGRRCLHAEMTVWKLGKNEY